jgi:poly-gamma-glutamate capsule biosynthesis protein CapA/YwtB (metallophosphatase superfamily)
MAITIALAGDTMLGRGTAEMLGRKPPEALVSDEVVDAAAEADFFLLNLECCISERGEPWPDENKAFFFRAPPAAVETLLHLGVDCVTLANNHALDFGYDALEDTLVYLDAADIAYVGAGHDRARARAPALLEMEGKRLAVLGATDHPLDYAARDDRPGVALAGLSDDLSPWLVGAIQQHSEDIVLVGTHWGPNMRAEPLPRIVAAGDALIESGATLVAGHSAHVFQGMNPPVLYDLGDFLDDYAVDPLLRNDLGLMCLVTLDEGGPRRIEALPLQLQYARTVVAHGEESEWIARRLTSACAAFGRRVSKAGSRLVVEVEPQL